MTVNLIKQMIAIGYEHECIRKRIGHQGIRQIQIRMV